MLRGVHMSWINWLCIGIIILGIILFLYGANYYIWFHISGSYDAVGWAGVALFIAGILTFLIRYIYGELTKKVETQNP
jgi:membrane protein implicated in regulation of membrane protease activity